MYRNTKGDNHSTDLRDSNIGVKKMEKNENCKISFTYKDTHYTPSLELILKKVQ